MAKTININGTDIRIKALNGERVLFFSDLDHCCKLPIGTVQELFAKNKYRLTESTDYIVIYPAEDFFNYIIEDADRDGKGVVCLTYRGFALLGKLIPDGDKLDIFSEILHEYYFETDEDDCIKPDTKYIERLEWGTKFIDIVTQLVKLTTDFLDKDIIASRVKNSKM